MSDYPIAYGAEHLQELINANDSCPDVAIDEARRIVELVEQRVQSTNCIISTDWNGFASNEFGYDNGEINQFAVGTHERDSGRATLFKDTVVLQNGWLQSGDGRRSKVEEYHDEEFEKSSDGDLWVPNNAQQYIAIIATES